MAKIVVRIPEPKEEYDVSNQKQINRAIALITEQLNSTFLDELKQETERYSLSSKSIIIGRGVRRYNYNFITTIDIITRH